MNKVAEYFGTIRVKQTVFILFCIYFYIFNFSSTNLSIDVICNNLFIYPYIYSSLSIYISHNFYLNICIFPSLYLSIHSSNYIFQWFKDSLIIFYPYLSLYLSVHISAYPPIYLPIYLSIPPSNYIFKCLVPEGMFNNFVHLQTLDLSRKYSYLDFIFF